MANIDKIKVAWICAVSNSELRNNLTYSTNILNRIAFRMMGIDINKQTDVAIWNTNGLREFEKFDDVELHVVCMERYLKGKKQVFQQGNIHYHFLREQNSNGLRFLFHQLFTKYSSRFYKNRRRIKQELEIIAPDIVHVIGAENPYYSLALLDVPSKIPTIVQLQALLDRIKDVTKVDEEKKAFRYKGCLEKEIFIKADYIGTPFVEFKNYIVNQIKPSARILDLSLASVQSIDLSECEKEFDFVYYAASITKAGEEAMKTFAIIHQRHPELTLDIVGGYDEQFKAKLEVIISDNNMQEVVFFEGRLPSHEDVICQIRKARFALLPLKMDILSSTLIEAMSNGLPAVTTITDGTPGLNKKRQSVLISPQNDFKAMADNVDLLLNDPVFANKLREDAALTVKELSNNYEIMNKWRMAYYSIIQKNVYEKKIYSV